MALEGQSIPAWPPGISPLGITQGDGTCCFPTKEGQGEVRGGVSSFLWLPDGGYYLNVVTACDHNWWLFGFISWGLRAFCKPNHLIVSWPYQYVSLCWLCEPSPYFAICYFLLAKEINRSIKISVHLWGSSAQEIECFLLVSERKATVG